MKNQEAIRCYLNVIKRAVALIESKLDDDGGLLEQLAQAQESVLPDPPQPTSVVPKVQAVSRSKSDPDRKKHIDQLMAIDCWPEAVMPFLVAKPTQEDQINRANSVLDMVIDRSVEGAHFLDFGCGEGWIAQEAVNRGVASSTGYDIVPNDNWKNLRGAVFTSDLRDLPQGYYDAVVLYDVLDHCHDPLKLMEQVKAVLKPNGVVYVRCHPWTSRHATHAFKQGLNKAYVHLFLNQDEMAEMLGQEPMFTRVEKNPLEAYRYWFNQFEIRKESTKTEPVSEFFHVPSFKTLLANEQQIPVEKIDDFVKLMQIQFVDYTLTPRVGR